MNLASILTLAILLIIGSYSQLDDYTDAFNKLKTAINDDQQNFKHSAYKRLAQISDTYGPRVWGSQALQKVIYQVYRQAKEEKFDNVRLEAVKNFTKWVRGNEELYLHSPRPIPTPLKVIGLGGSVPGYVKTNVIVVSNYDELDTMKDKVKGKIVVYNVPWTSYGGSVDYRVNGAWRASQYGAVAALVRSVTPDSIQSVHTGVQFYNKNYPKIPIAAISTQDAEMLGRMQRRGQTIVLQLRLESQQFPNTYSNNVVFQITGKTKPEQILLLGGHIDSWDTGSQTGANDDGGGFLSCFQALRLIKNNLEKPQRTIRFIAWSGQQWGDILNGAHSYLLAHKSQLKNHIVAFEDDLGSTTLQGFGYLGGAAGKQIVKSIADKYLGSINATKITNNGGGADTSPLHELGIPTMANQIQDSNDHKFYFAYHHSAGDSMTIMNPDQLDSNVLGIAAMFYILADIETSIPKPTINSQKLDLMIKDIQKARGSQK